MLVVFAFDATNVLNADDSRTNDTWWSLKPLTSPIVPTAVSGKYKNWPRTEVDRFVLDQLTKKGFHPAPVADKRTLLRRAYFDLTGLPPTPADVSTFLKDKSPNAWSNVIERLLASPRYGECWARHWLDVVHYADSHGNDQDRPRPNAWPYRDYVINAFNADKPYARFVEEQLAGDVLYPDDPQATVATGFIAAGPWDYSSQIAIVEDTVDKKIGRNLDRDDMVMTTMSTFVSATIHCARCHNHKFDPIPQTDYYNLQAVFAGVDRADRPFDADVKNHQLRQALLKKKRALDAQPTNAPSQNAVEAIALEKELRHTIESQNALWTVLDPSSFNSTNGATLTKQPDHSILASGPRPDKDTYTITASSNLKTITALRVEVLSDPTLPMNGPGRQDNGNLHLSEVRVSAKLKAPNSDSARGKGAESEFGAPITLQNATADFNQQDWAVDKSIDNNPGTAWGIYPEVGHSHFAVYEFKTPLTNASGTTLTVVLDQLHGRQHLIGRVRVSVTDAPLPIRADVLPYPITRLLEKSEKDRSPQQINELFHFYRQYQIDTQLAALPAPKFVYAASHDFPVNGNFTPAKVPRPIFVLKRGDVTKPGDPAMPGALSCVSNLNAQFEIPDANDEGLRRAALARWITAPQNPLTWRSIVNRAWHYHFGRGIVDSPNDFGHMGSRPTHPELLDWLAIWFRDNGGSIKNLHRLILNSAVYMQSSADNAEFSARDSGNQYLWRMNRTRLDAECVRDSILQITGKLDLTMGGPAVKQFHYEDPVPGNTPIVDYNKFDVDAPENFRRSVYRFIFRTLPDPFMDCLDCADPSQLTPVRNLSLTALQAMATWNDRFIVRQCEHFAARLAKDNPSLDKQLEAAYQLALNRPPTKAELETVKPYAAKHSLAAACRVILNSNEFLFVD